MQLTRVLLKPKASQVLTAYLKQCNEPPWTSYFVKVKQFNSSNSSIYKQIKFLDFQLKDVENDQWGRSHFNWTLETGTNYHILRTACFPYLKYHCSKREIQDLSLEDKFFRFLKIINLGEYHFCLEIFKIEVLCFFYRFTNVVLWFSCYTFN